MAVKKVYKYYFPDMRGNVSTKAGAEKKARAAYQRNKDEIDAIFEEQGGRLRRGVTIEDWFVGIAIDNLGSKYGGKNTKKEDATISQALETTFRSHALTAPKDVLKRNILSALKDREPHYYWFFHREHKGSYDSMLNGIEYIDMIGERGYRFYGVDGTPLFMYEMVQDFGRSPEWVIIEY